MWRPVLEQMITYTEMCNMYDEELDEVNMAIDIFVEQQKKQQKKSAK